MLEIYHKSMENWWRERLTWRGVPVPVVFASPDRAFSEMNSILDRSRGTGEISMMRGGTPPLPMVSISEAMPSEYDATRDNAGTMRAAYVTPDLNYGYSMDWPTPEKITYQVDFWAKTNHEMWYFRDQVRRWFKLGVTYFEIDFNDPIWTTQFEEIPNEVRFLGKRVIPMKQISWTNTSNLEPAEGFKDIRFSLTYSIDAWMARGYTKVPLVHTFTTEVREVSSDTLLP